MVPKSSSADDIFGIYYEEVVPELYRNESELTTIPAFIGGSAFAIPATIATGSLGLIGYGIGLPFGLESDFAQITGAFTWYTTGYIPTKAGSFIAGAPFYILEKAFYDVPNALFFGNKKSPDDKQPNYQDESFPRVNQALNIQSESFEENSKKIVKIEEVKSQNNKCIPKSISLNNLKPENHYGSGLQNSYGYVPFCD